MAKYKKSYLKLLQETVDFYSKDSSRRGMGKTMNGIKSCVYLAPKTGNMCAVGRCMTKRFASQSGTSTQDASGILSVLQIIDIDVAMKPEYRGYNLNFWLNLQSLHDSEGNWDEKGITESGECEAANIRIKIIDGIFA